MKGVIHYGAEVATITRFIAEKYGVNINDLFSKKRTASVAEARQYIMYILMKSYSYSEPKAAAVFNRHHTTAHYAKKVITDRIQYRQMLFQIDKKEKFLSDRYVKVIVAEHEDGTITYHRTRKDLMKDLGLTEWHVKKGLDQKKVVKGYRFSRELKKIDEMS